MSAPAPPTVESSSPSYDPMPPAALRPSVWDPSSWQVKGVSGAPLFARLLVHAAIAGFVLWIPTTVGADFVPVLGKAVVYSIIALSLNVLMGYAGQVSLGHAAFVGAGALTAAVMTTDLGLPWIFALGMSMAVAGILSLGLGAIALRIKGLYLAIVTIVFGLVTREFLFALRSISGGGAAKSVGRPGFVTPDCADRLADITGNGGYSCNADVRFFGLCVLILVLVWLFDWRLVSSRAGRAIEALRDDERVAASWGINVTSYKLTAFVIAGAIAGLAGALLGGVSGVASPTSFELTASLTFLLMTVVGGLRSRPGVVVGGAFIALLPNLLEFLHHKVELLVETAQAAALNLPKGTGGEELVAAAGGRVELENVDLTLDWLYDALLFILDAKAEAMIGAALLLITLLKFPGGIGEQFGPVFRWLSFERFKAPKKTTSHASGGHGGAHARP